MRNIEVIKNTTIKSMFEAFSMLPPFNTLKGASYDVTKVVFYTGVLCMFNLLTEDIPKLSDEDAEELLNRLHAEVYAATLNGGGK